MPETKHYSKEVIAQAKEENTMTGLHAIQLFNEIFKQRIETDAKPWGSKFKPFSSEEATKIVHTCFECAEWFRMGIDFDLQARLDKLQKVLDSDAPSIVKPSMQMIKDQLPTQEFHELSRPN